MAPRPPTRSERPGKAVALLRFTWGPRHGPQAPNVRSVPAKPWRSFDLHGGPDMAPRPPTFGASRQSRGAPSIYMGASTWPPGPQRSERPGKAVALLRFTWGPRHGPQAPNVRSVPAKPWRSFDLHGGLDMAPSPPTFGASRQRRAAPSIYMGASTWPPGPQRSERPGKAVALLRFTWGPRHGPQAPHVRSVPATPRRAFDLHGGLDMAPSPPTFGASRQRRAAP